MFSISSSHNCDSTQAFDTVHLQQRPCATTLPLSAGNFANELLSVKITSLYNQALNAEVKKQFLAYLEDVRKEYAECLVLFEISIEDQKESSTIMKLNQLQTEINEELILSKDTALNIAKKYSEKLVELFKDDIYSDLLELHSEMLIAKMTQHDSDINSPYHDDTLDIEGYRILLQAIYHQRLTIVDAAPITLAELSGWLKKTQKVLTQEKDTVESFLQNCITQEEIDQDHILHEGICWGTCVDYLLKRFQGAPAEESMSPTARGRFFQALHEVNDAPSIHSNPLMITYEKQKKWYAEKEAEFTSYQKSFALLEYQLPLLFASLGQYSHLKNLQLEKQELFKRASDEAHCASKLRALEQLQHNLELQISNWHAQSRDLGTDTRLLHKIGVQFEKIHDANTPLKNIPALLLSLSQNKTYTPEHIILDVCSAGKLDSFHDTDRLSSEFFEKMWELAKKSGIPILDVPALEEDSSLSRFNHLYQQLDLPHRKQLQTTFVETELGAFAQQQALRIVGSEAPQEILQKVTDNIKNELTSMLELFCGKELIENLHVVYVKLSAPYELRDPNYPNFTLFQTSDFQQFLTYFSTWFIHEENTHCSKAYLAKKAKKALL